MIGQIVNYRYEVLEKVGDGEFFSVYKSRDKVLNRLVALKVLFKSFADAPEFRAAVRDGYQSVFRLEHPHIARVYEAELTDKDCFVACEYVRGTDVKERIKRAGPISVPLALDIIIPVLEALEYAHANRVVHGDIRPQDIIVSPDGDVKLTDFGLSPALRQRPEVADRFAMRSVHYAAPEIAEGDPPSVSSDLYSTGVVLYEMLTGVVPHQGATAVAVALKQARELPTPPRAINTAVPKSLSDLVMRSIERSPADRFQNASAVLADLRAIRDALRTGTPLSIPQPTVSAKAAKRRVDDTPPPPPEPSLKKPYFWLTLLFIVVVLASLGITMYFQDGRGSVRVPSLLGKTLDEAQYEAKEAGIRIQEDDRIYNDIYEAGRVCSVNPRAGSVVERDSIVRVKISKGPARRPIPDLIGLRETEAYRVAGDADFVITKRTEEYSDKIPVNAVISQSPEPGLSRVPGSSMSVVVSLGPKPDLGADDETQPLGRKRQFTVAVEVPADAVGLQEVKIIVVDDRGETTDYQEYHDPGDVFTESVTTYGSPSRIAVYVGDELVSDESY